MGGSAAKGGKARPRKGGLIARLYDGQLAIEFSKEVPPYSTILFLRGGQRRKCRDSIERRRVFHPQGGFPLGHLKHERGRASLGPKRGGDLCGIGGRIEGRPFRKGLWNGICARPDLRGACGKAAAPALGLGSTGRQTGAGQIRWGSTLDGRRCAAVVASQSAHFAAFGAHSSHASASGPPAPRYRGILWMHYSHFSHTFAG